MSLRLADCVSVRFGGEEGNFTSELGRELATQAHEHMGDGPHLNASTGS